MKTQNLLSSSYFTRIFSAFLAAVFILSSTTPVLAQTQESKNMSEEQRAIYLRNIKNFDLNACSGTNDQDTEIDDQSQNGSTQELAKQMLENNNITYWTNGDGINTRDVVIELSEGKKGSTTASDGQQKSADVNPNILKFILDAAKEGKIMVNALTDKEHSSTSNHYKGEAVDLDKNPGNTTIPINKLTEIASKYDGVKNNETSHHHFDFTKRPSGTTSGSSASPTSTPTKGVEFETGMTVNTDGVGPSHGNPYHQSQTSYANGKLNADKTNYIALAQGYAREHSLTLGDLAVVQYKGKTAYAIYADNWQNVNEVHGEGSYRLVKELGMPFNGTSGGADSGVRYTVYPDTGKLLKGSIDQNEINKAGQQLSGLGTAQNQNSESSECACSPTGAAGESTSIVENLSAFSPDPAMEKMLKDVGLPRMKKFIPLYQKAAQEEGMPFNWEILAGLHWTESDLSRKWTGNGVQTVTGPFQQMTSELSQHLDDSKYSDLKTLIVSGGGLIDSGKDVNDKEFVVLARLALARWVKQALGDDYEKLKAAPVPFKADVNSDNVFWRIMGRWNPGAEGFQGFTGYNNTNYKAPQPVTGAYGTGLPWNKPGVATTYYLLKKNGISGADGAGSGCVEAADEAGNLSPIDGTKSELATKILSYKNSKLKLGNSKTADAQKQETDIKDELKKDTLVVLLAMLEQSGVPIPLNALKSDHGSGGAHGDGRAIDVGYYGNGNNNHKSEGDKLYKFLYKNREALKIDQMIWQYPPKGYKCIYGGKPADCDTAYPNDINDHYHHIHVGVRREK